MRYFVFFIGIFLISNSFASDHEDDVTGVLSELDIKFGRLHTVFTTNIGTISSTGFNKVLSVSYLKSKNETSSDYEFSISIRLLHSVSSSYSNSYSTTISPQELVELINVTKHFLQINRQFGDKEYYVHYTIDNEDLTILSGGIGIRNFGINVENSDIMFLDSKKISELISLFEKALEYTKSSL